MISPVQAAVLGIIQGLTEFLPVSSSAHLILFPRWMGWQDPGLAFDVALHLGTLTGVFLYFWKDLLKLLKSILPPFRPTLETERRLVFFLIVATVPAALVGLILEHRLETVLRTPTIIGWSLLVMGTGLFLADRFGKGHRDLMNLSLPCALAIGFAQSLALIPGVSRSGITITVALAMGFERRAAARFSFLMSIPIIAGAGILKFREIFSSPDKAALIAGFTGAAIAGIFAIWLLFRLVQAARYTPYVVYRWALGIFVLLNLSKF